MPEARTGRIAAAALTDRDVDAAAQVGPLLDQVEGPVAPVTRIIRAGAGADVTAGVAALY